MTASLTDDTDGLLTFTVVVSIFTLFGFRRPSGLCAVATMAAGPIAESILVLRYMFKGETLRNGRVLRLEASEASTISGAELLHALGSVEANVPLHRLVPYFYSKALEGWERLRDHSCIPMPTADEHGICRVEVMLEQPALTHEAMETVTTARRRLSLAEGALATAGDVQSADAAITAGGFFGIGVYNSKSVENVGTLWRSAFMLGAAYIFTIGQRNAWEKAADTYKTWRHIPALRYEDWASFAAAAPYSTVWVAVEMGGIPLSEFVHPERAVYILGAEDAGLPKSVVSACQYCISLDGVRASSYNVAVAGSIVMYDRCRKLSVHSGTRSRQQPHGHMHTGADSSIG